MLNLEYTQLTFFIDYLSPFYMALYFQGLHWKFARGN